MAKKGTRKLCSQIVMARLPKNGEAVALTDLRKRAGLDKGSFVASLQDLIERGLARLAYEAHFVQRVPSSSDVEPLGFSPAALNEINSVGQMELFE